jgi:very-short-patch-repair endonuclease
VYRIVFYKEKKAMPHRKRDPFAVIVAHRERGTPTEAERLLWRALRDRRINAKFRRQVPVGRYIVDFVCLEHRLIIESDGPMHESGDRREKDEVRDSFLKNEGFRVLRLPDDLVRGSTDLAVQRIIKALEEDSG